MNGPVKAHQLLIQPPAFSKMIFCINSWSEGFEILSPFFSECSFLWLQHFFSLVLVICLSWYLHLKLSHEFYIIYPRMKKSNQTYKTTSGISSFQNGFNHLFSSTGFYFKSKVIEASHTRKNMSFNFGAFFSKCTFLRLWHFFLV